jgi:predicted DNA-binding protein
MVSRPKGNQSQLTGYFEAEAVQKLKALSEITRVPQAAYLREALDDLLKKYGSTLRKGR